MERPTFAVDDPGFRYRTLLAHQGRAVEVMCSADGLGVPLWQLISVYPTGVASLALRGAPALWRSWPDAMAWVNAQPEYAFTKQDQRPERANEESHMTQAPKTEAQLKKEAAYKAFIAKQIADSEAAKAKAAGEKKSAKAIEAENSAFAKKAKEEWDTDGILKGPQVPLPGVPPEGMAWEFALGGANAAPEYKKETLEVVRRYGGEILEVKGSSVGSALTIWVQVRGSLSAFVSDVVNYAKANEKSCLRRCVEGLPGCEPANARYAMKGRELFKIPAPVKTMAIPISLQGRKKKANRPDGADPSSVLPVQVRVRIDKPDTLDAVGDLAF